MNGAKPASMDIYSLHNNGMDTVRGKILKKLISGVSLPTVNATAKVMKRSRVAINKHYDDIVCTAVERSTVELTSDVRRQILIHFVAVKLTTSDQKNLTSFEKELARIPYISDFYLVTGTWDYILQVNTRDKGRFSDFMTYIRSHKLHKDSEALSSVERAVSTPFHEVDGFHCEQTIDEINPSRTRGSQKRSA